MGVNSLPNTVTRQRRDCDSNPGPSAPESSTLTTQLPSRPIYTLLYFTIYFTLVGSYIVIELGGLEYRYDIELEFKVRITKVELVEDVKV